MHPIERLRYVARAGDVDPSMLAEEAADALGSLAYETPALVPACRRLLESHPTCGPLWWVAARLLVTEDVWRAASVAKHELIEDATLEKLAATFPARATVVIAPRTLLTDAVAQRPDLSVYLVGAARRVRQMLGRIDDAVEAVGFGPDKIDEAVANASLVVLEALAAGPQGYLLDIDQLEFAKVAGRLGVDLRIAMGVGRILPAALFDAVVAASSKHDAHADDDTETDDEYEPFSPRSSRSAPERHRKKVAVLDAALASAVIGPSGIARPAVALRRSTCRSPQELLVSLGTH